MNAITTTDVTAQTLEDVLANGDLSKLTADQRVAYYFQVCKSLGLNPYTRPFDYITLNGKRVLYAKRDATDQLRQNRGITLAVTDKHIEDDLFIVTVRATDAKGRSDEDFGAVPIAGLKGEARANAILKGITKAKRRVTLSICGLGMNDESEVVTIPGAVAEDLVLPLPDLRDAINDAVPMKAAAATTPRPERKVDPKVYAAADPLDESDDQRWMLNLEMMLANAQSRAEVVEIGGHRRVRSAVARAPDDVKLRVSELLAKAYKRFGEEPDLSDEALGEVVIAGEDKVMSGDD